MKNIDLTKEELEIYISSGKYEKAAHKLESLIKNIYNEYNVKDTVNPIENFKCNKKTEDSVITKLSKSGAECTRESVDRLHDIVRARIVCPFLSDVYKVVDDICKQQYDGNSDRVDNGIIVVEKRDYIKNPKASGYRSYHLVIKIPVFSNGVKEYVNAEIQVRTVAMDMLFSLEHKLRYKKKVEYPEKLEKDIEDVTISCGEIDDELDKVVKAVVEDKDYGISVPYPFMEDEGYKVLKSKYSNALDSVREEFEKIHKDYCDDKELINPIEHMKDRIKSDDKIIRKLYFDDLEVNLDNIYRHVKDVAGFRIVCSFLSDVEELMEHIEQLEENKSLFIVERKNYIEVPKDSGYRGFHYVVLVPVNSLEGIIYVPVEIQIRTVAMEMWASLEEKICYHKKSSDDIVDKLKKVSVELEKFDNDMDYIYRTVIKEEKADVKVKVKVRSKFGRK